MFVHENWVQNRQATAACDFCNRKKTPLQKCQDCNINICKNCIFKGTLENDARHMLASEAANSFDWHQWGKGKDKKPLPTVTRDPKPSYHIVPPQPVGGCNSGYAAAPPDGNLEYSPAPYHYHMPVNYNQLYSHAAQGLSSMGYLPAFSQYSSVPQYPNNPPPFGICGALAGQPIYHNSIPQQPSYGLYSPQVLRPAAEYPGPANILASVAAEGAPQSSQEIKAKSEDVQDLSEASSGHSTTQVTQDSLTPESSAQSEDIQLLGKSSKKQQNTHHLAPVSDKPIVVELKKTDKPRQALEPRKQTVRALKRSRRASQNSAQGRSKDMSSLTRQPIKKARRENVYQASERGSRARVTARVSKRSLRGSGDDDREEELRLLTAKKSRRDHVPETRIVNLSMRSTAGVQRLREILGTPQDDSRGDCATKDNFQSLPSSSKNRSSFSSQALKKTRLDELLDAAGVQPVPWPVPDLSTQIRDEERSCQLSAKPENFVGYQDSFTGGFDQHPGTDGQVDDDEAREAAMILLNMRHGN